MAANGEMFFFLNSACIETLTVVKWSWTYISFFLLFFFFAYAHSFCIFITNLYLLIGVHGYEYEYHCFLLETLWWWNRVTGSSFKRLQLYHMFKRFSRKVLKKMRWRHKIYFLLNFFFQSYADSQEGKCVCCTQTNAFWAYVWSIVSSWYLVSSRLYILGNLFPCPQLLGYLSIRCR